MAKTNETKQKQEVAERALAYPEQAKQITVTDAESYTAAATLLKGIKDLRREADDVFDEAIAQAHKAHKAAIAAKKKVTQPLDDAERILKAAIAGYTREQKRLEAEKRRQLEEEARKRLEADREAAAELAESDGDTKLAKAILGGSVAGVSVELPSEIPKVEGVSTREKWEAEVYDLVALLAWVLDAPEDRVQYIKVDQAALNSLARRTKGATEIPGVDMKTTTVVAA